MACAQTRRAGRYTNFRSLWKAYYYDRYYVLRSKVPGAAPSPSLP